MIDVDVMGLVKAMTGSTSIMQILMNLIFIQVQMVYGHMIL